MLKDGWFMQGGGRMFGVVGFRIIICVHHKPYRFNFVIVYNSCSVPSNVKMLWVTIYKVPQEEFKLINFYFIPAIQLPTSERLNF